MDNNEHLVYSVKQTDNLLPCLKYTVGVLIGATVALIAIKAFHYASVAAAAKGISIAVLVFGASPIAGIIIMTSVIAISLLGVILFIALRAKSKQQTESVD